MRRAVAASQSCPSIFLTAVASKPLKVLYWHVGQIVSLGTASPYMTNLVIFVSDIAHSSPTLAFCENANRREHQPFVGDKAGRQGLLSVLTGRLGSTSKLREAGSTETAGAERVQVVNWEGYQKIDRDEVARGATKGKPREKLVDISQMLKIAGADRGQ